MIIPSNRVHSKFSYHLLALWLVLMMGTLTDIPEEILFKIVGYLHNERQKARPFNPDPSITKDLQNIRLVCHRLASLSASFLFENIVCDEELYTSENVFQIIDFATQYPHLALQVRRLQWKVAPNYAAIHKLASDLAMLLQKPIGSVDIQRMYMLLLKPYQGQIRNRDRMSVFEPCSQEDLNVPLDPEDLCVVCHAADTSVPFWTDNGRSIVSRNSKVSLNFYQTYITSISQVQPTTADILKT